MELTLTQRLDRLDAAIREDRVIRGDWLDEDDNGRDRACLLAQLSPEAGEAESASACPADVMPQWLAELTPWMDDNGSLAAWPGMIRRYAALARRWHVLTPEAWRRLDYVSCQIALREAMRHTADELTLAACRATGDLLSRAATGGEVSDQEWAEAWAAARAARADRITTQVLDAIEAEIAVAETAK